ncbi:MAG: endonuclease/exonuclease/phosphatase family protein [Bacteroidia bacterium]|nr:endonuclease/exonuclease/phosphatase family protein [Bacteroidia bacterium]
MAITVGGLVAPWIPVGYLPELQLLSTALPFWVPVWAFWTWRSIRLRSWKLIVASLFGLVACGWIALGDISFSGQTEPDHTSIKIVSFNVGTFDFKENNIKEVGELIQQYHPDLVAMQEFRNQDVEEGEKALTYLANMWGLPNKDFLHLPFHVHGAAFFSRYPILKIDTLFLPRDEINSGILITVDTDLGPIGIANVHFSSFHIKAIYDKEPDLQGKVGGIQSRARKALSLQQEKVEIVLEKLKNYPYPVIIAGDLNATPHSRIVRQLADQYQDSFQEAGYGRGWSFPVFGPFGIRIDYQFASHNLQPISHQVIRNKVSDHFPLLGTYQLKQ